MMPLVRSSRAWFVALLAPWLAARLALIWSGWPETAVVADDAYYYFTIARNLGHGLGATFDGLAPTNGFHPLWQLLLVPVFAGSDGADLWTPVRAALTVSTVFDALSAVLILRCVTLVAGRRRALWAVGLWLFCPLSFLIALRGMEASLSTFCVLLVLWILCRAQVSETLASSRTAIVAGLAVGLCGLARTDNLVTVGLALAFATFVTRDTEWPWRARTRWIAVAAGSALLVTLGWFAWSLTRFGMLVQVSGQVKLLARRHFYGALPWDWHDLPSALSTLAHAVLAPLWSPLRFATADEFGPSMASWVLAVGTFALAGILVLRGCRSASRRTRRMVGFLGGYLGLHVITFGALWHAYASWYALPPLAVGTILVAACARWNPARARWKDPSSWLSAGLLSIGVGVWVLAGLHLPHGARGPEIRFTPLLDQAAVQLPRGAVLGAFDAGALGYVAGAYDGIIVTNLDGLVNNKAYQAMREGRYLQYVLDTVDTMAQDPGKARMFLDPADVEVLRRHFAHSVEHP